jgi:hypothetical protein
MDPEISGFRFQACTHSTQAHSSIVDAASNEAAATAAAV